MGAANPTKDSLIGRTVGRRYRVDARLSSGAVGTVYLATDTATGSKVAIKLWRTADSEQVRARFLREAEALNTLKHPNIVEVFGVGQAENRPYVAMEFLEGTTLEELLAPGEPLDCNLCFDVAGQFLSALAFAHKRGVVHRDLKPDNIFIVRSEDNRPRVKLLDFGLAKFLTPGLDPLEGALITMTGMVMGTPLYMPPEQAAGGRIDARVDVYAAGCILFEMLSGRLPYLGNDYGELMRAHVTAPIPKLARVLPDTWVSDDLQALLERAMAKTVAQRFPDAGHMLSALRALPKVALRAGAEAHNERPSAITFPIAAREDDEGRGLLLGAALGAAVIVVVAVVVAVLR